MVIAVIALFGLVFGSFINVVIHRLPEGRSVVTPGSSCPSCRKPIRFYDNIPLVSFIVLRGRCRQCGQSISWRYPLVELFTACCLLALYFKYGLSAEFAAYGILTLFLIPIGVIDMYRGLILNRLTIPCCILGILLILGLQVETWKQVVLGAVSGGLIVWIIGLIGNLIFRKESMGMGDVKLLVLIGVYVGFPEVAICLFFGIFLAAVVILSGMAFRKLTLGDTIPFGPFIALGALVYLLWGESILGWYLGRF